MQQENKVEGMREETERYQLDQGPLVMYRNRGRQQLCLQKCLASAMHYLGYTGEAKRISDGYSKIHLAKSNKKKWVGQFQRFKLLVIDTMKESQGKVRWCKAKYDPFDSSHHRDHPVVTSLKAAIMNGNKKDMISINHSVCFVGAYVFDSNMDKALPITRETMDHICNNVVDGAIYDGIIWSREIVLKK